MNEHDRSAAIDAYFDAMDAADPGVAEGYLADTFVYRSLAGDLEGPDALSVYMDEHRAIAESVHEVTRRVHGPEVSCAEGTVTGSRTDGTDLEARFCNVFEFDGSDAVTAIAVYINDA